MRKIGFKLAGVGKSESMGVRAYLVPLRKIDVGTESPFPCSATEQEVLPASALLVAPLPADL